MYKERKETTHREIGEKQHTLSYIYIYIYMKINTMYVINKWLQDRVQEDNITKEKEKKST